MGAFQNAGLLLPDDVLAMAARYGYAKENLLILSGSEERLKMEFPETYRNILSCRHQRDGRSPMEYAQDLVASWVVEDYFLQLLQDAGCQITAAGADRERKILPNAKVSATSDFQIRPAGQDREVRVEFMCDYQGYWRQYHKIDLRDDKFKKLQREQALFLGIDAQYSRAILLDFGREMPQANYISSHFPYGGKPAYSIPCPEEQFFPLTPDMLAEALAKL